MSEFPVGMKVVCVDDEPLPGDQRKIYVKRGEIYTISTVVRHHVGLGLTLRGTSHKRSCGYHAWRFKPVEPKAAQLFRDIAAGVSAGKPIVPDDQKISVPLTSDMIEELISSGRWTRI